MISINRSRTHKSEKKLTIQLWIPPLQKKYLYPAGTGVNLAFLDLISDQELN